MAVVGFSIDRIHTVQIFSAVREILHLVLVSRIGVQFSVIELSAASGVFASDSICISLTGMLSVNFSERVAAGSVCILERKSAA